MTLLKANFIKKHNLRAMFFLSIQTQREVITKIALRVTHFVIFVANIIKPPQIGQRMNILTQPI